VLKSEIGQFFEVFFTNDSVIIW